MSEGVVIYRMPRVSLAGKRFGKLVVVRVSDPRPFKKLSWLCECDCGGERDVITNSLTSGKVWSCGCHYIEDLAGRRFNRLTVVSQTGEYNISRAIVWKCVCDCGNFTNVASTALRSGQTKSCGCLQKETSSASMRRVLLERNITWRKAGQPNSSKHPNEYHAFCVQELKDFYVRSVIKETVGIPTSEITPEMIEVKKEQINLYRLIKQGRGKLNGTISNRNQRTKATA